VVDERCDDIDDIAALIGYALEGCIHGFSRKRHAVSTIRVEQTKQKFDTCRVYCTLADEELVREKWCHESPQNSETNVPDEYTAKCLMHDIRHYNRTYAMMIRLVPEYSDAITSCADFPHLLATTSQEAVDRLCRVATAKFAPAWHLKQVTSELTKCAELFRAMQWDTSVLPSLDELLSLATGFYPVYTPTVSNV